MLTFDPTTHTYRFLGEVYPSVTQLTDRLSSLGWCTAEELETARERGTDVHSATMLDDLGDLAEDSVSDEVAGFLAGWRKCRLENAPDLIAMEQPIYHPVYRYAGTFDRVWMLNGKRTMVDLKTGVQTPVNGIQLAGYTMAWNALPEHANELITNNVVVYLTKDGDYRIKPYNEFAHSRAFLALIALQAWHAEFKK